MFCFFLASHAIFIGCIEQATFNYDHDEGIYHILVWYGMVNVLGVHHANIYLSDQFF